MQICSQNIFRGGRLRLCCLWTPLNFLPTIQSGVKTTIPGLNWNSPILYSSYSLTSSPWAWSWFWWSGDLLPVMVFIHGESYNWGSGNLFDGRVLIVTNRHNLVTSSISSASLRQFLNVIASPSTCTGQWVIVSDFGDSYRIYQACELVDRAHARKQWKTVQCSFHYMSLLTSFNEWWSFNRIF